MTVQELAARERQSNTAALFDDEVRDVFRARNKRRRKGGGNKNEDSDDQVERWMEQQRHAQKDKPQQRHQQRWQARQLARSHHQERLAAQSWWWMENNANKFDAASLVSTSESVSLVLAPVHKSWHNTPDKCDAYPHFYIVPREAVASGAACDRTVWQQVQQYQQSLRHWTAAAGKAVIFAEVVLPSKSSSSGNTLSSSAFYQARIHAMVVPRRLHQDAPLAFQSALNELVLEHGTHQRKMLHLRQKTLPQLVPANFAYLYVEWDAGAGNVLVLEEQSANVNVDWPLDVLGGRLGLDPLRMRRRQQRQGSSEDGQTKTLEMATRVAALKDWKKYDWTLVNNQEEDEKDTAKAALS